jgi:hypothetical protein
MAKWEMDCLLWDGWLTERCIAYWEIVANWETYSKTKRWVAYSVQIQAVLKNPW